MILPLVITTISFLKTEMYEMDVELILIFNLFDRHHTNTDLFPFGLFVFLIKHGTFKKVLIAELFTFTNKIMSP